MSCQDNILFMRPLPAASMKLIVTSPPYNIGKKYERRSKLDVYIQDQTRVIAECVRLLHPEGSICWQVGNHIDNGEVFPLDIILYHLFKNHGLKLRNRIIWQFEHGLHCKKRLSGRHETILWFTKGDSYTFNLNPIRIPQKYPNKKHYKGPKAGQFSSNPLGKNPGDVWTIPNVKHNHIEKTFHPCQFPIELAERLVLSLTDAGDSVFDPYMGVGSAVLAAVTHEPSRLRLRCCASVCRYCLGTSPRLTSRNSTHSSNASPNLRTGKLMHVVDEYSHRYAREVLKEKRLDREVRSLVDVREIGMARGSTRAINDAVERRLSDKGWALDPRVHANFRLDINGLKNRIGLTVQTGNITRAFYDLMKFEVMHKNDRIEGAVLIVPTAGASRALGSNIANFTRVTNELGLFQHIITVPCLVLGIDEAGGDD